MSGGEEEYILEAEEGAAETDDVDYVPEYQSPRKNKPKGKKRFSMLWSKFTIVDRERRIASCDTCGVHMKFSSTISNLKNHLVRKHNYNPKTNSTIKPQSNTVVDRGHFQKPARFSYKQHTPGSSDFKPRVSEVGMIDDVIFKVVVGDEGDEAAVSIMPDQVVEEPIETDEHMYTTLSNIQPHQESHSAQTESPNYRREAHESSPTNRHRTISILDEKKKRQKILDLQLECLEMKKYNMQIETLMMEQQMNLPRSIFTENLRGAHTYTRGTQTEIGGQKTKVFYLSNKNGEAIRHFISLQDPDD